MLWLWFVVAGYAVLMHGCIFLLLRVILGKVDSVLERLDSMAKEKDNSGKAPLSGGTSDSKRDDKATATGKPVNPNRPHTDKDGK